MVFLDHLRVMFVRSVDIAAPENGRFKARISHFLNGFRENAVQYGRSDDSGSRAEWNVDTFV